MLTVGASLSLTGRFAAQGRQAHHGLTLWAEAANRAGGLLVAQGAPPTPVCLRVYDDASRRDGATANTTRLIVEDRVALLFGPYSSVLALVAAEVAGQHNRTLWNHGGSSDAMDGRGWRQVISLLSPASRYFVPLLAMAVQTAGRPVRRVALVHGARGTFPAAVVAGAQAQATVLGLEIVLQATYPDPAASSAPPAGSAGATELIHGEGSRSPADLVQELAARQPDVILGVGTTEADIAFAREIRRQGIEAALIGLVAAPVQPFQDALGAGADGVCGPSQWEPSLRDRPQLGPTSAQFASTFRARFGIEPEYPAAQAYAAGIIAAHCLRVAGSPDDLALRRAAAALDYSTFYGRFRLDPQTGQQIGHQIVVVQWQAGRKQVVWPPGVATAPPQPPQ